MVRQSDLKPKGPEQNGCPLLRVCVHSVCVCARKCSILTAVCTRTQVVKFRIQILSMGYYHT